jgi:molecular chaperone GrpE
MTDAAHRDVSHQEADEVFEEARDITPADGLSAETIEIVNIVENLQRASASITPEARAGSEVLKQVGEGIDMTMQELLSIFERNGIRRVNPEGQKFDHNFHQAVAQVPADNVAPGSVVQVLQAGYVLHDRLLKPAMVTVAASSAPDTSA